jgi:hypothetical protein
VLHLASRQPARISCQTRRILLFPQFSPATPNGADELQPLERKELHHGEPGAASFQHPDPQLISKMEVTRDAKKISANPGAAFERK